MEYLKHILLITFCVLSLFPTAGNAGMEGNAASPPTYEGKNVMKQAMPPEMRLKLMRQGLQLTDEQQVKVKEILESEYLRKQEISNDRSLNQEQKREKTSDLAQATHDNILTVLTPQQQDKFNYRSKLNKKRREEIILLPTFQE